MIARHVLSSRFRPLFVLLGDAREKNAFKLRSELISVEDKRNESDREWTSWREVEILGELRTNKGGRNGHVAGVPRSTVHNCPKAN